MSSCLRGGGGRAYRLKTLDLEVIKSPSTSWISNSSSPSSTLSESSNNCPLAISTRKPRTPRKRPNQTYNEAAAILSTAYPKIFPTKNHLTKPCKFTKSQDDSTKNQFLFEPSDLLMPFSVIDNSSGFLLHPPPLLEVGPNFSGDPPPKGYNLFEKVCQSPGEINSQGNSVSEICDEYREDFDAESMLDEEIGAGIDSIMGDSGVENESNEALNICNNVQMNGFCYGYPVGLGFEFGNGLRREMRAMRNMDEGDWWRFPSVNVLDLAPAIAKSPPVEKKKKKKVEKCVEIKNSEPPAVEDSISNPKSAGEEDDSIPKPIAGLLLKLNYDTVLNAWCDKGSPFAGDSPASESAAGNDVQVRLAQIDLFSENGGIREASVLRYKEKRRTRLFSKKIRYQVRKVNADRRPRMKGRFVRTPNSSED